jgi:hypothetical protein
MNILTLNLVFSTLVFWIAAKLYLFPKLATLPTRAVMQPILLLHALRHLGLMFLAPGAVLAGIPAAFAYPSAFGDLLAALLALAALYALVTWAFNIEGTVDLFAAIALAIITDAPPFMGPAYWIPAFWVPALLVTHAITFVVLTKHWRIEAASVGR